MGASTDKLPSLPYHNNMLLDPSTLAVSQSTTHISKRFRRQPNHAGPVGSPRADVCTGPPPARLHHRRRIHQPFGLFPVIGGQRHDSVAGFALYDVQALYVHAGLLKLLGYLCERTRLVREPQN